MTASPEEPPSVMSKLRESVQPAKPASPIRLLCEELPNVYVFFANKMLTTCSNLGNYKPQTESHQPHLDLYRVSIKSVCTLKDL